MHKLTTIFRNIHHNDKPEVDTHKEKPLLLTKFPNEILLEIFQYCDPLELGSLERTCKQFYLLIRDNDALWKRFILQSAFQDEINLDLPDTSKLGNARIHSAFLDLDQISLKAFLLHPHFEPLQHYTNFLLKRFDNDKLSALRCLNKFLPPYNHPISQDNSYDESKFRKVIEAAYKVQALDEKLLHLSGSLFFKCLLQNKKGSCEVSMPHMSTFKT